MYIVLNMHGKVVVYYVTAKQRNELASCSLLGMMQCAYVISLISRPLEATSVATRIGAIPLDKK